MSRLADRIHGHGNGTAPGPQLHPYGTAATPMVMPMSEITYAGDTALYGTVHPLVTADGAVIPARSPAMIHQPAPAPVVPAGRY